MICHRKRAKHAFTVISLGLTAMLSTAILGCETDLFDEKIYPWVETREECFTPETWRCNECETGTELQLCRGGFWNPWYNCAWNGGTCEASEETSSGSCAFEIGGCIDPPQQQIECPTDAWLGEDPNDTDTDTGPFPTVTYCSLCDGIPVTPDDFEDVGTDDGDPIMMPGGASDGDLGCCSVANGNAYWGVDEVVMQSCTNGCCAFADYTTGYDDYGNPEDPIRHGCCE